MIECIPASIAKFYNANADLIQDALVGLAVGVVVVAVAAAFFPEFAVFIGLAAVFSADSAFAGQTAYLGGYTLLQWAGPFAAAEIGYAADQALSDSNPKAFATAVSPFGDIAVPERVPFPIPSPSRLRRGCRHATPPAVCRRVATAARRYVVALSNTTSVEEALAVTVTRLRKSGGKDRQSGTAKILSKRLLDALTAQQAAGRAFAGELVRAHSDIRVKAAGVRRAAAKLSKLEGIPKYVLTRLEAKLQLSRTKLAALFRRALAPTVRNGGALDFVKELNRPLPTTGLQEAYNSLTFGELGSIVVQLNYEHRIGDADANALVKDLMIAERACVPLQRRGPMDQFVADVRSKVQGPYAQVLADAAVPLFGDHPYPNNVPPTANFHPLDSTGRATATSPLRANFSDSSVDSADGGYVGCRQWDFGDSTSGADNISFERNPTHDYAKPGTYTVTLKAVDDDGFATSTVTGRVTVNP
jgi:hypothetical protein